MCTTCGCSSGDTVIHGSDMVAGHHHHHHGEPSTHPHLHDHDDHAQKSRVIVVEQDLLARNDARARENRRHFESHGLFVTNLVSSPGSGKTALLVRVAEILKEEFPVSVIEGDQQTSNDVERIRAAGVPGIQINTGKGCHLDAHMVSRAMESLAHEAGGVLFIENVGNLVCPAAFDLGEAHKVVIISTTEGEDKPLKYPDMFAASDLMLINKIDLLPHLDFDVDRCIEFARRVNPKIEPLLVSARSGEGLDAWLKWIRAGRKHAMESSHSLDTQSLGRSAP
jgi:hydrogenase nickel incorporation protein HypB